MSKSFVRPTLTAAVPGDLSLALPKRQLDDIIEMIYQLDKIAPGTANYDTLLYGAEVKFYSARLAADPGAGDRPAQLLRRRRRRGRHPGPGPGRGLRCSGGPELSSSGCKTKSGPAKRADFGEDEQRSAAEIPPIRRMERSAVCEDEVQAARAIIKRM